MDEETKGSGIAWAFARTGTVVGMHNWGDDKPDEGRAEPFKATEHAHCVMLENESHFFALGHGFLDALLDALDMRAKAKAKANPLDAQRRQGEALADAQELNRMVGISNAAKLVGVTRETFEAWLLLAEPIPPHAAYDIAGLLARMR